MAKWKGITAPELIMLRQIERINYQLRQVVKEFGMDSRIYNQYENMLTSTRKNTLADAGLIRETSTGVLQLRADKRAIREYMDYTAYEKSVDRLLKMQTVGQVKQAMIDAYHARTKIDVKTRAERKAAFESEKRLDAHLFKELDRILYQYYKLEDDIGNGRELASHDQLRAISTGFWSSHEDLQEMLRIANAELQANEHKVKKEYDDYLAGL